MKGSEWTLVFFTLFIQTAVGLFLTFVLVNNFTGWKNGLANGKEINDKLLYIVCALFIVALIISFFHLGNVKNAVYALSNLADSWLSREILAVVVFGVLAIIFTLLHTRNMFTPLIQNIVGALTILSGLVLLFVMAKLYMLEVVPAWNNAFTPVSFYLSSFILGGLTFIAGVLFLMQNKEVSIIQSSEFLFAVKIILGVITLLVLSELIVWIYQIIALSNGDRAAVESYNIIIKGSVVLFVSRIISQILGLAFLIYSLLLLNKGTLDEKYVFISYVLILLAELLGRYLFYAMYTRVGV